MNVRRAIGTTVALALGFAPVTIAGAQPRWADGALPGGPAPVGRTAGMGVRGHVGIEVAIRLARSTDPDERLRGIERAAAVHTPEALAFLERAAGAAGAGAVDPHAPIDGVARTDPRALLVVVRALADWLDTEEARAALASIVAAPAQAFSTRAATAPTDDPSADDSRGAERVLLARQQAAVALAESDNLLALDALLAVARSAGPGQMPALDALAIHPPAPPLLGSAISMAPATIGLAVAIGDLRSLDAIEAAMSASDPAQRAAALTALGVAGDSRILDEARTALRDRDPRVRLAAGDALARLVAPDAALAIEGLVGDDATVIEGLRLAQRVESDGVIKAAAARAAAAANAEVRAAAVAALGRQTSPLAVGALEALVADPGIQGDVACAMARSPSGAAMAAIERLASGSAPTRRLAARAYLVRRLVRGERSAPLDALLKELEATGDARDRAVGVQARVTLGERPIEAALGDADARVRRAAALGALGQRSASTRRALLGRLGIETDETTRQVLAVGLEGGDPGGVVPTLGLVDRARMGGPDAPLAALALAQRGDERHAAEVDALLEANDPVLRAHVARGLGASGARDGVGRLARAYAMETDARVRRAIVAAIATRTGEDRLAPARQITLRLAARLDPDRVVRWTASHVLATGSAPSRPVFREVAWLRLVPAEGATLPRDLAAALVDSDGMALPIAFDEDGYAVVPGVSPGDVLVRLAPRLPPYEALPP